MANSLESVFMVEASRELRETQKKLLCGPDSPTTESKSGYYSQSKYSGKPIVWTDTIKSIPIGASMPAYLSLFHMTNMPCPRPKQDAIHRGS